jgi:hypothetical protein
LCGKRRRKWKRPGRREIWQSPNTEVGMTKRKASRNIGLISIAASPERGSIDRGQGIAENELITLIRLIKIERYTVETMNERGIGIEEVVTKNGSATKGNRETGTAIWIVTVTEETTVESEIENEISIGAVVEETTVGNGETKIIAEGIVQKDPKGEGDNWGNILPAELY